MAGQFTNNWDVDLYIGHSEVNYGQIKAVKSARWSSFINGGFVAWFKVESPGMNLFDIFMDDQYLFGARQLDKPCMVRFRVGHRDGLHTPYRTAIISNIVVDGKDAASGTFEFVALDPISWYLNRGDASGRAYRGRIGTVTSKDNVKSKGVIEQSIDSFVPEYIDDIWGDQTLIKRNIGATVEYPSVYYMLGQSPKAFISSLLEWSSPFTPHQTSWIVASGEDDYGLSLSINESYTPISVLNKKLDQFKYYYGPDGRLDILSWKLLNDPMISVMSTRLTTSGISAVSGEYIDCYINRKSSLVEDSNTEYKINPYIKPEIGFKKAVNGKSVENLGKTYISSLPEFNGMDVQMSYNNYISGRARQMYFDLLTAANQLVITVNGDENLYDSTDLGRSFVQVLFTKLPTGDGNNKTILNGNWLLQGWDHKFKIGAQWTTDIYLSRLEYDATAIPGQDL